eukprot:7017241-Heterocapsa_arctica.AAC.1
MPPLRPYQGFAPAAKCAVLPPCPAKAPCCQSLVSTLPAGVSYVFQVINLFRYPFLWLARVSAVRRSRTSAVSVALLERVSTCVDD